MTSQLGRIQVVTGTPPCSPGKCVICGGPGGPESKFIDFGFEIDFYGVVYFCMNCINEVLTVLDYIPKDHYDEVCTDLFNAKNQIEDLELENRKMRDAIKLINDLGVLSNLDSEQSNVVETVSKTKPGNGPSTTAKPKSSRSVNESRSSSVRNNDKSTDSTKYDL